MESEKKITRVHAVQSKRKAGVFCVFEDCRASLSYGGFQQHFVTKHLPKIARDAASAEPNAEPVVWESRPFRDLYSVNRCEPARLAKYGLLEAASSAQLQDEVARLTQLVEGQSVLLASMAHKLDEIAGKVGASPASSETAAQSTLEAPAAEIPIAPATKPTTKKRPAPSPTRSSARRKAKTKEVESAANEASV
jgi:hypothetical protein